MPTDLEKMPNVPWILSFSISSERVETMGYFTLLIPTSPLFPPMQTAVKLIFIVPVEDNFS